ncbi:helix-turn-helix domain-containing protein [Alphaproteobacteria bacterium]|nr:helix-turn-helix domain-containing protein [Alphaproteobacteria bacterium]
MSDSKKKTKGKPDSVDVYVGKRLRVRRSLLGLSQEKLADAIGLTFQQVQKYERGVNRISAGRLYQFSKILSVPITYFYEKVDNDNGSTDSMSYGLSDNPQEVFGGTNILEDKDAMKLIKIFSEVENSQDRQEILRIVKSMASISKKH